MPFDGSGNFVALGLPDFPAIGGQPIYATQFNNVITDLMNGFGSVLTRDGQTPMTGDLQMSGNRITGLDNAIADGDVLVFGQAGGHLDDLTVDGPVTAQSVNALKANGNAVFIGATISGVAAFLAGVNMSGTLSPLSTINGRAFLGSAQNILMDVGLGGQTVGTFAPVAGSGNGGMYSTKRLQVPVENGLAGMISGADTDNFTTDTDKVLNNYGLTWKQFSYLPSGPAAAISGFGGVAVYTNSTLRAYWNNIGNLIMGGSIQAGAFVGNASSASTVPWTGVSGRPTALSQFTNDLAGGGVTSFNGRAGPVSLTGADVTGALGFNPISGISGAMVNAALGFSPYNSSNPSGFISGISSGNVTGALGFTPYNATNPSGFLNNVIVDAPSVSNLNGNSGNGGYVASIALVAPSAGHVRLNITYGYFITGVGGSGGGE